MPKVWWFLSLKGVWGYAFSGRCYIIKVPSAMLAMVAAEHMIGFFLSMLFQGRKDICEYMRVKAFKWRWACWLFRSYFCRRVESIWRCQSREESAMRLVGAEVFTWLFELAHAERDEWPGWQISRTPSLNLVFMLSFIGHCLLGEVLWAAL